MRRLERGQRISFVDVAGGAVACPFDRAEFPGRLRAREDGRLLSDAAAFAALWRAILALRPPGC